MAGKLAKEMYKKHENGTQSVQMWVVENKDKGLLLPRKWCLA
jgi:hypothetical protein